jgi:hypothetical protein
LLGNLAIAGLPISDAYEYYNYSLGNTRLEIKGFGANISIGTSFPLPAIYSSPDVLYKFPVTFGNKDSSNSGYSITIPPTGTAIATVKRSQKRVNEADAWGSLTTPAGTFDVLRVKSTINRIDSVITTFLPLGVPSTTVEYKWIAKGKKIPALQVNTTIAFQNETVNSITYWGEAPSSSSSFSYNHSALLVSPNPANESTMINFGEHVGKTTISLIAINGAKVATFEFLLSKKNQKEILPLAILASGNYMVQCKSEGIVSQQKLTVR